jgi:hypothetical protein
MLAQFARRQTTGQVQEQSQRQEQRHDARIAKAQARRTLTIFRDGRLHNAFDTFL